MNLFDNIIQSQFNNFTGKQAQPQVPSFATPKAPRTTNYVAPNVPTPTAPKISQWVRNGGVAPWYEWTIDETQSPVFKAVQWAANLFTGIQKRLWETAQSDIDRKQQKMDQKWIQFADHLINKGYTKEQVFASLDELKKAGELQVSPNFSERLVWSLSNRMWEVQRTTERLANEPLTTRLATGIPSYAWDVVGTAFEPVWALLSPVVQKVIEKTGQTQNVEEVGKWWEWVRQSNPNFADAIEGSLNVASLAPLSPKVTAPIKSGIKTIGTKTLQTAEKIAPNLANQAKKLTSQAEMWFRKQAEDIAVPKLSEMGMREKQKVTGNVIETKPWLFKKEELVRSPQEALAIEEVSRMLKEGKIKKWGTELQKSSAISDEINGLAEALKGRLDNTPNPVTISKPEVESFINDLATNVKKNPIMVWDMQESAYKIIQNLKDKLTKDTYTPSDLLEIRKQLDSDVQAFKWETVFDPKIENAFSSTLKEFRQWINNKVAELVPDAQVRSFLDRQSALYTARDNVDLKWSKQANTTIGRILSKIQSTTWIPRTEIIELATAGWLLWASTLAPIITPIVVWGAAIAGGRKALWAILSPKNKVKLANILTKIDQALKKNPNDADFLKAKELFSKLNKNGWTTSNIRSSGDNWSSTTKPITPTTNESKVINPTSPQVKPVEKTSATQANWPRVLWKMWKVETNTTLQSPTAYEAWIRRPYTLSSLKAPQPKQLFAWENAKAPPKWKTGWFKWADGKMRFEIDDSGAKISFPTRDKAEITKEFLKSKFPDKYWKIPNFRLEESLSVKDLRILESLKDNSYKTTFKLWDILQHDELFKQYPELKDMDVMLNTKYWKKDWAMEWNTMMIWEISNSDSLKWLILHELQHNIQVKEKFALWSNPIAENQIIAKEVQKKIDAVNEKMMKNKEWMDSMSNSEFEQMKIRHKELEAQRSELEDKMDRLRKYESEWFDQYNRSAWEVEARNVQSRMNLTAKERTIKSPESTEDVPRPKQIIRMDSKWPSMLIKKPKQSATMGDMETKKLIEDARSLWKYDGSYDVTKWKKLYRGWNEDGVFWTDDIDIAKSFWDEWVVEKIITMKKPLDVRSKAIREYIKKNTDINIDNATSAYSRSLPEFKKLTKWAKENWYDWIIGKTSDNWLNFTWNEFVTLSSPKPLSPQKTVRPKNLTEWKQSATMGDMETKKLIEEARKYKSADEFVKNTDHTPQTTRVYIKSKFRDGGGYADVPVIREEKNITLYQGGTGENRQFWTPNKEYAKKFGNGEVVKKTGNFYQIDNGNRMTDVYVDADKQLTDLYNQAHTQPQAPVAQPKVEVPQPTAPIQKPKPVDPTAALKQEARKYKSAEEFEKALRSPRWIWYWWNMWILWRATSKPYKPNTKTIIEHWITDSWNTKSYAKDILLSNDYWKSEPYIISKDAKIASWSEWNDVYKTTKESAFSKKSIEEFKRRWFDWFSRWPDEIVIFNHEKINPFNIKDFFTNYIK